MARLTAALAAIALVYPALAARELSFRANTPAATQASSGHALSSNVLTLRKSGKPAKSSAYLTSLRAGGASASETYANGAENVDNLLSEEYIAEIEWDGVPFEVIVDTGSSDTWLVQAGFTCVDYYGDLQTEADCYFGPTFNGTFDEGSISDENFNIEYGDNEFLNGALGYENVTIAGITVEQEVALVNYSYWYGDGVTSGLLGLAYPLLTSAYAGTDAEEDSTQIEYNSIITTLIKDKLIEPVFSLALERNSDSGYLALGGLPPVNYTGDFATTPILKIEIYDEPAMATQYSFYTIIADAYIYEGSEDTKPEIGAWGELFADSVVNTTQFPIIVDSGTTLLYLPTALYEDIAALYDPPATYIDDEGASFAPCNATVPELGVEINGTVFWISEADLLMQDVVDSETGYCMIGPQDGSTGPYILGDTFLNNVVSVFDIGASEIRFAANNY